MVSRACRYQAAYGQRAAACAERVAVAIDTPSIDTSLEKILETFYADSHRTQDHLDGLASDRWRRSGAPRLAIYDYYSLKKPESDRAKPQAVPRHNDTIVYLRARSAVIVTHLSLKMMMDGTLVTGEEPRNLPVVTTAITYRDSAPIHGTVNDK
ncbi:hypothetical protein ACJJTC_013890 [Scirpophaga incertulas]